MNENCARHTSTKSAAQKSPHCTRLRPRPSRQTCPCRCHTPHRVMAAPLQEILAPWQARVPRGLVPRGLLEPQGRPERQQVARRLHLPSRCGPLQQYVRLLLVFFETEWTLHKNPRKQRNTRPLPSLYLMVPAPYHKCALVHTPPALNRATSPHRRASRGGHRHQEVASARPPSSTHLRTLSQLPHLPPLAQRA